MVVVGHPDRNPLNLLGPICKNVGHMAQAISNSYRINACPSGPTMLKNTIDNAGLFAIVPLTKMPWGTGKAESDG